MLLKAYRSFILYMNTQELFTLRQRLAVQGTYFYNFRRVSNYLYNHNPRNCTGSLGCRAIVSAMPLARGYPARAII